MSFVTFGEKLELFYVSIATAHSDMHLILDLINDLEQHIPLPQFNEDATAMADIIKDCRKKGFQLVRAPFADSISKLITQSRKKLMLKVALDTATSAQHSQRHYNILLELVGSWSNVVSTLVIERDYDISRENAFAVLSTLYNNLIEMCFECFKTFRQDKDLENWTVRLMTAGYGGEEVNLESLFSLVTQLASMRELLNQHYAFLHHTFSQLPSNSLSSGSTLHIKTTSQQTAAQRSAAYLEGMLLVSAEEMGKWRELEALYSALESGYLSRAIVEAFSDTSLLEIEDNVFVPQACEDLFYLMNRCSERAAATGSEGCIFAVGNKIVELLNSNDLEDSHNYALLFTITTGKSTYRHCVRNECISSQVIDRMHRELDALHNNTNNTMFVGSHRGQSNSALQTPVKAGLLPSGSKPPPVSSSNNSSNNLNNNSNALSTPIKVNTTTTNNSPHMTASPLAQLLSEGSTSLTASTKGLITDVTTSRAFKGVNSWLAGVVSPYMIADEGLGASEVCTAGQSNEQGGGGIAYSGSSPSHVQPSSLKPPLMNGSGNSSKANLTGFSTNSTSNTNYNTPAAKSSHSRHATNSHKMTPPSSAHGSANTPSLDELLLSAFCEDADGASVFDAAPDSMSHSSNTHSNPREVVLEEEDWLIQLNTLAMVVSSVKSLHAKYSATMGVLDSRGREEECEVSSGAPSSGGSVLRYNSSNNGNSAKSTISSFSSSSSLTIVLQELSQIDRKYRLFLDREIEAYSLSVFRGYIERGVGRFCARSFSISGQELDDRSAEFNLLSIVKRCLSPVEVVTSSTPIDEGDATSGGHSGKEQTAIVSVHTSKKDQKVHRVPFFLRHCSTCISVHAFHYVLCALSTSIVKTIMEQLVHKKTFTEWGAMLLYQEVAAMTLYLESLLDSLEDCLSLKACHEGLLLVATLLGLEQPKEVSRFKIPGKLLSEAQVRAVLARRSDYSKSDQDAIANVKIHIV